MMMVGGGGGGRAHSESFTISNFHVFILLLGGGVQLNVLNSLDIIKNERHQV